MLARPTDNAAWHVVHVDQRHAPVAIGAMRKSGYDVYDPQMRVMKVPRKNKLSLKLRKMEGVARPVLIPLFGGYKFVWFDLSTGRWHELFDLLGVNGMIVNGGLPAPVNQIIIDSIRALEVGGAIPLDMPVKTLLFTVGQRMRIDEGPFRGFDGPILSLDESKQRVLLEILIFGAPRSLAFEPDQLSVVR